MAGKGDLRHLPGATALPGDANASAALGDLLRAARESRAISLDQLSRETKIPARYLSALEHGNLAALPGGTYTRGEVIAFAAAVGLDRQVALDHLDRSLHPAPPPVSAPRHEAQATGAAARRPTALIIGMAALAIAMTVWVAREYSARQRQQPDLARPAPSVPSPSSATAAGDAADRGQPPAISPKPSVTSPTAAPGATMPAASTEVAAVASDDAAIGSPPNASAPELTVVTDPPGARVTVDGIGRGITPITISQIAPGDRRVRVTLSGFTAVEQTVRIQTTGSARITIPLREQ